MRSEKEMMDLILNTAKEDERIRAVILNGSRTNPNAKKDPFQDYDVIYLVKEVTPFEYNMDWIRRFGELMILQMPENEHDPDPIGDGRFVYLMQFMDGNRIDLTLYPIEKQSVLHRDSLSILLLDKDGVVPPFDPPSEKDYLPKPPTEIAFDQACNEFWWVCPYAAKGLWRREILYAKQMLDQIIRPELMKMLTWYYGIKTDFQKNPGKAGKLFHEVLRADQYETLLNSFGGSGEEETWQALFNMCALFRETGKAVAAHFGYHYPELEDKNVSAHLLYVKNHAKDSITLYD